MNKTKSSMIDKNPKDAIKLDLVVLDKSQTYSEEKMLTEDGLYRYLYQPAEQLEGQKNKLQTFSGIKIGIGLIKL